MWVAGSHRFMQSANVSPPPPGRESALAGPPVDTLFCVGGLVDAMEGFTSDGAGAVEVGERARCWSKMWIRRPWPTAPVSLRSLSNSMMRGDGGLPGGAGQTRPSNSSTNRAYALARMPETIRPEQSSAQELLVKLWQDRHLPTVREPLRSRLRRRPIGPRQSPQLYVGNDDAGDGA
jgi:hypothetical protein